MQDMIPRGDRSIRNIPVSGGHRRPPARQASEEEESSTPPIRYRGKRPRTFLWWGGGVVVASVVLGLLLSGMFAGAQITITPKTQTVTPPATLAASLNPGASGLAYQTMSVTVYATTTLSSTGVEQVSKYARGVVTIYNAYSAVPQKLIANTRLAAPGGQIYRIREAVTVPGYTKKNGSTVPGSTTVTVYGDKPGAEYNRGDTTQFTIPGFEGDPRYSAFSATSQGGIDGGFIGEQGAVSKEDLARTEQSLKQQLEDGARKTITANVPEGFMLVSGGSTIVYTPLMQTAGQGTTVLLSQNATAGVAIVRVTDLAAAVAQKSLGGYEGEPVSFGDPSQITVAVGDTTSFTGPITLSLSGTPTLVWQFDQGALKQALLGLDKSSLQGVVKNFEPAIARADATIRPFWESSFPKDPEKLTVTIEQ